MDTREYIQSGAIESYVMGLADEADVLELQRLRQLHPEIDRAVVACEEWWEEYALSQAIPVDDSIRDKVLAKIHDVPSNGIHPLSQANGSRDADSHGAGTHHGARIVNFSRGLVAAAVILGICFLGLSIYRSNVAERAAIVSTITDDPAMVKIHMPGVSGKEGSLATLYWDPRTKFVYITPDNLPKAPAGKQYQLWALVDGKPVDAGLLEDCDGICKLKPVQRAQAFAITLENAGGSPTPTLSQMYVLGNVKS